MQKEQTRREKGGGRGGKGRTEERNRMRFSHWSGTNECTNEWQKNGSTTSISYWEYLELRGKRKRGSRIGKM